MVENISLKNKNTLALLELDVVTTPYYILDKVDWGQIESTHHSYKYVNQIGVYVTGTTLETRDIVITGWIVARSDNQMSERKKMLNRFVNPQQLIELKYKEYAVDFLPDKSIKYSATVKENNNVICKFEISGLAPDPLFRESTQSKTAAATTRGMFHFPLIIGCGNEDLGNADNLDNGYPTIMFGLRQPSLIVDVYNKGAVAVGMTLVFKAMGTMSNPSLINVRTQEYFKINKTLVAGETVTINTTIGEKKVIGELNGIQYNYFKYRDLDSSWLQLEVGDNLFRYDADTGLDVLECYVYFYNKYLEVQECY